MGKRFLRSITLPVEDLPASVARAPFDLPVNPLSHVLLRLQTTNVAPAATGTYSAIDDAITQITDVTIRHNGENIVQGSLRDLMVLNAVAFNAFPGWNRLDQATGQIHDAVFPICLGRRMYDGKSAFPATRRGELQMLITAGADGAAYSDINVAVETVELIEDRPEEYMKYTARLVTPAIGQFDVRLPIGNPLLGVLLFDTGQATLATDVSSWGLVKLLKDNVEQMHANADFRTLAGELNTRLGGLSLWPGHQHQVNAAGAGLEQSDDAHMRVAEGLAGYAYLDYDPLRDGAYELETEGVSDLLIRGIAESATAVRWYPIEKVKAAKT